jgi:ABC-type multidrug transport system fused ATPase/permease subunit
VLDDGAISGIGTHDQLLKTNEIYREINSSQQEGVLSE